MRTPRRQAGQAEDGRVQRGARNRAQILDAVYELVREGELQPTAERVAERAGVAERTVFRHFDDMESLHAEMSRRLEAELQPLLEAGPPAGSVAERLSQLVGRRARFYESVAPFRRSGNLHRPWSRFLQQQHAELNRRLRRELAEALGPKHEHLLDALDLITSFEAWDRLRSEQRLAAVRARAVLDATAQALVARSL